MCNKIRLLEQIGDYLDYCRNIKMMSEDSLYHTNHDLHIFADYTDIQCIEEITNTTINDWIKAQHLGIHIKINDKNRWNVRPCKNRTINTRVEHIKSMVKWYKDMDYKIPGLKIPLIPKLREDPPRQVYYTREMVNRVLTFADRRAWLMIRLAFECGLRLKELTWLQVSDISDRVIDLGDKAKCKEKSILVMSLETKIRLEDWIERENITNYLWPSPQALLGEEKPLTVGCVRDCMAKPFLKAGFTNFYPHALRHSFATEIIQNGASDSAAQHMLRHSSFDVTRNYIHSLGVRTRNDFSRYMHCKPNEKLR